MDGSLQRMKYEAVVPVIEASGFRGGLLWDPLRRIRTLEEAVIEVEGAKAAAESKEPPDSENDDEAPT